MAELKTKNLQTQEKLFDMCKDEGVIYAGSTDDPDERADQHQSDGFSGTLYYARTQNMEKAENKLLAERDYLYNKHKKSNQAPEPGYIYLIQGKRYTK